MCQYHSKNVSESKDEKAFMSLLMLWSLYAVQNLYVEPNLKSTSSVPWSRI